MVEQAGRECTTIAGPVCLTPRQFTWPMEPEFWVLKQQTISERISVTLGSLKTTDLEQPCHALRKKKINFCRPMGLHWGCKRIERINFGCSNSGPWAKCDPQSHCICGAPHGARTLAVEKQWPLMLSPFPHQISKPQAPHCQLQLGNTPALHLDQGWATPLAPTFGQVGAKPCPLFLMGASWGQAIPPLSLQGRTTSSFLTGPDWDWAMHLPIPWVKPCPAFPHGPSHAPFHPGGWVAAKLPLASSMWLNSVHLHDSVPGWMGHCPSSPLRKKIEHHCFTSTN